MPHAPSHVESAARRRRMAAEVIEHGRACKGVAVMYGVSRTLVYEAVYAAGQKMRTLTAGKRRRSASGRRPPARTSTGAAIPSRRAGFETRKASR